MTEEPTDAELLARWRNGDAVAGRTLVERYYPGIYRFFSSKLPGEVGDLVQSTFLACIESRDTYEQRSSFKAWLFGIARNKLYAHFRHKRLRVGRTVLLDPAELSCEDLGGSPSTWLRDKDDDALLRRALPRIPLELQLILELYLCEGLTGAALAEVMDMSENTLRSKFRRAKELLRKQVAELDRSPAADQTLASISTWLDDMQEERDRRYPQLADDDDDD
ncbi:MAG: sigma-70 family RNA polymerase sigma factor [Myxococcales bacterium]|nr:sigma-70 family RNA polymerase sigma factor [Myxococcales bacterium]